jgi:sugar phosphate isomerase/epimerase
MSDDYEPDEDRMQAQRAEWKRLDDLAAEIAAERANMETDLGKVLDPNVPPKPQLVIKPGYQHARRAYELGMDDEYSNAMKARYGGEW